MWSALFREFIAESKSREEWQQEIFTDDCRLVVTLSKALVGWFCRVLLTAQTIRLGDMSASEDSRELYEMFALVQMIGSVRPQVLFPKFCLSEPLVQFMLAFLQSCSDSRLLCTGIDTTCSMLLYCPNPKVTDSIDVLKAAGNLLCHVDVLRFSLPEYDAVRRQCWIILLCLNFGFPSLERKTLDVLLELQKKDVLSYDLGSLAIRELNKADENTEELSIFLLSRIFYYGSGLAMAQAQDLKEAGVFSGYRSLVDVNDSKVVCDICIRRLVDLEHDDPVKLFYVQLAESILNSRWFLDTRYKSNALLQALKSITLPSDSDEAIKQEALSLIELHFS